VCLTGGEEGVLAASLSNKGYDEARKNIEKLTTLFGKKSVYVELQRHCGSLSKSAATRWRCGSLKPLGLPLLATNGVRYARAPERKFWMSSPAFGTTANSKPPDGFWNVTTSVISVPTEEMVQLFSDLRKRFTTPANSPQTR